MSAPDFTGLPKAEVRNKPRFWWWRTTRKLLLTCIAYAGAVAAMLAFALGLMYVIFSIPGWVKDDVPPIAGVDTPTSCAMLENRLEGVIGIGPGHRVLLDGTESWYGFAKDRWTMTVFRDAEPGRGIAVLKTEFIAGICFQRLIVHLPAPSRSE